MRILDDNMGNNTFWVRIQKGRTPNEDSSLKAVHVQVAKDKSAIYRGEKGYAWNLTG